MDMAMDKINEVGAPAKGFRVSARAKPAFASISSSFNQRELAAAPMPVLGDTAAATAEKKKLSFGEVMQKASARAFRGGAAGFAAGVVQVGTFMWMRTTMNYQYANGGTLGNALSSLYKEGGIPRFYKGVSFAIIQNPMSRFGDTAANTGVLVALQEFTPNMPVATMTAFASAGGATWRIFLTPVDTFKTTLQVQGNAAFELLKEKVKKGGIGVLYNGAFANFAANWVGNYPWFVTFNYLQASLPHYEGVKELARNAFVGMCASIISDCVSNSLRVVKTIKQTSGDVNMGYVNAVKGIVEKDGIGGLFGRGLKTRLITNVAQSMVFSVAWKAIEKKLNNMAEGKSKPASITLALPPVKGLPPLGPIKEEATA